MMGSLNEQELQDFVRKELLIEIPEIIVAVESLNKPIEELTDAMNRLADLLAESR